MAATAMTIWSIGKLCRQGLMLRACPRAYKLKPSSLQYLDIQYKHSIFTKPFSTAQSKHQVISTMIPKILFVSSTKGKLHTLHYNVDEKTLEKVATVELGSEGPSWQYLNRLNHELYSTAPGDPEKDKDGFIHCYKVSVVGQLQLKHSSKAHKGGVSIVPSLDVGPSTIFLASYDGGVVQSFENDDGALKQAQTVELKLDSSHNDLPNINKERQDSAHPHEVAVDPKNKFILVPDLGHDYIRVFAIKPNQQLEEKEPIRSESGAGPRHVTFDKTGRYLFCVEELANTVQVYKISYDGDSLRGEKIQRLSTLRDSNEPQYLKDDKPKPSELYVSNDNKHLYVANRYDASIDGLDTIAHYTISDDDGKLTFQELSSGGGTNIWHFSLDEEENLVAVASEDTSRVVVYKRDIESGRIMEKMAEVSVEDAVNVNWWFSSYTQEA